MREIKFRAYIKNLKLIFPVTSIDFNLGMIEVDLSKNQGNITKYYLKEVVLMQYTGVNDKNGIKIYEGDVMEGNKLLK